MDNAEARACRKCNYPVTHHDIFDDYGPASFFVAIVFARTSAGLDNYPAATDTCPNCHTDLTYKSTKERRKNSPPIIPFSLPIALIRSRVGPVRK